MSGSLFIVATPIGNLEDLSPRARQTLAEVDLVAAEDTRRTGRLLMHFGIETPLFALHEHNEEQALGTLLERLSNGDSIAIVSDAGTPLISDPGFRLVRAALEAEIAVHPVPGPSAVTAALSVAGLPTDRFCFEGFLPAKQKARQERIGSLASEPRTLVLYESVHRIDKTLADLADILGSERLACLGRELTKLHEQSVRATLGELVQQLADGTIPKKGEFVLVLAGAEAAPQAGVDTDVLLRELALRMSASEAAAVAARVTGQKRNELYRRLLDLGDSGDA